MFPLSELLSTRKAEFHFGRKDSIWSGVTYSLSSFADSLMQPNLFGEKAIGFDKGFTVKLVNRRLLCLKEDGIRTVSDSRLLFTFLDSTVSLS